MQSVSVTTNRKTKLFITALMALSLAASAQENSIYSRFGMGDQVPGSNILNRGMGGISAGFSDYDNRYDFKQIYPKSQSLNYLNPASYGHIRITTFDIGLEVDKRTMLISQTGNKFNTVSPNISYVQLGIPLSRKHSWGMALGLRPVTRINYKVEELRRVHSADPPFDPIDSASILYQGSGGSYQAFVGIGKAFKNLSIGVNTGYFFGTRDYSSQQNFIPDSVLVQYVGGNFQNKSTMGGIFFQAGIQYTAFLNKKTRMIAGAYGNTKQKFNGNRDYIIETIFYDAVNGSQRIDSVSEKKSVSGKVEMPTTYGFGLTFDRIDKWTIGADFTATNWSEFRFFDEKDSTQNSWMLRLGGQITPNVQSPRYWSRVTYRAGFGIGKDYIKLGTNDLPLLHFSFGGGFPIRKNPYTNQYTSINLAVEYTKRGTEKNYLRENVFRVAVGLSLSDLWFVKRKYD